MTLIGLIGAGNIGGTLARLASAAGYEVLLSNSRGPDSLRELAGRLGDSVTPVTAGEAAARADLLVASIPLSGIDSLPVTPLAGRTVLDTANYYPERDGRIPALDARETTTSELVQQALPESRVVKAFNNIVHLHLATLPRPSGAPDRSALPIAGDSAEAKVEAAAFISRLGYDALDTGPLAEGWRFERGQPAYCLPYVADPEALLASSPGQRPAEAAPAGRDVIDRALARAAGGGDAA